VGPLANGMHEWMGLAGLCYESRLDEEEGLGKEDGSDGGLKHV
jgi:hypothetical protein